ncbi:hypothetical protein SNQ30_002057 [Cronobacter sakazakii]|nr:hypothetical protein [Cronobacter sakazakii]
MATQPTNNPVPSESPRDLKFNAGKIDEFVTSLVTTYVDRFGNEHYTIEGLSQLARQVIAAFGWIPVNSFQAGATITLPNQILKDTSSNEYYRWDGSLPKVVPAGSTPESTGGTGVGGWISVGDSALRSMLASISGAAMIGTNHRGTLAADLNAIDRRPDGYSGGISAVLATGADVEIDKDINISAANTVSSNKTVTGVGGKVHETTGKAATWRVQGTSVSPIENVTFNGVRSSGSVLSTDDSNEAIESFAVFSRFSKNLMVNDVRALPGLTGGVYLSQAKSAIVNGVIAQGMVYHPGLARGGYGVLTDNAKETIINNVTMDVNASPDGRHLLYLATGAGGDYSGNRNVIANNLVGRWIGRDDRNQWFSNIRTGQRFIVNNALLEGGNGGIALNPENGPITDYILSNKNFDIVAYDSNPVYGVGQINVSTAGYNSYRFLITNGLVNMRTKDSTIPRNACVAYNITGSNGMLSNCVITAPGESSPILVGNADQGLQNVTISNIHDNIASGSSSIAPLISFTGNSVSNVTVRGVSTQRSPMFNRLFAVTDLTVDFSRKARLNFSGGTVAKVDVEGITGTVTPTTTGFLVQFPSHVTQKAIENCSVKFMNAGQANISSYSNKVLTVNTYAGSGGVLNMLTATASVEIILYS